MTSIDDGFLEYPNLTDNKLKVASKLNINI